ncbi:sugar kinase [Microbulbifer thermotolerans]|uniref:Sugar kinase n=1 Tax=Microbulbifer thermotolerans TaxID=252514 RepID=F1SWD0_MICTH|nr:sugar kinase [Microbulbifer thermotolerans]MCX2780456.1 sugar kinase [Microbulbifer thermotolerans]MCX2784529.1 sugar kinase [Microbulbifer thermotolerans]MCX2794824.1 sugar kinase [Microbulbifer thermotolerans]MCX2802949.1 sugar kinase [Microbulbifer thermotolerans]MCX2805992.1 sugar kinase [Microbulbifer thermotolerans]
MTDLVILGESMLELSQVEPGLYRQSFAGDVHSVAVYFKRLADAEDRVRLLTAVGNDSASDQMIAALLEEDIDTSLVFRHPNRQLGLYIVSNDACGERNFSYWRSNSAAREIMSLLRDATLLAGDSGLLPSKLVPCPDLFFFSGISLAVLTPDTRPAFWDLLLQLRDAGARIVFDPNYRPKLWASRKDTRTEYALAFEYSHLVLPGIEDLEALYGVQDFCGACEFLEQFDIEELVIKDGPNGVYYRGPEESFLEPITPVEQVVDTTAAGDSFNGSYLAFRSQGASPREAIARAATISALVIQHKGALVDKSIFKNLIESQDISK